MKKKSQAVLDQVRQFESPDTTYIDPQGGWPVVWDQARGCTVTDVDGKAYLDLTAAFGVAAAGHSNGKLIRAAARQMRRLLHGMGDVHPHAPKARLAAELSRLTFERWTNNKIKGRTIFGNSGFEAIEAALKTAFLLTGREKIVAFEGGYHGVGYGSLNATHRAHFKEPFKRQMADFADFAPFPAETVDWTRLESILWRIISRGKTGAILVEPMQARGGIRIPPPGFLKMLRRLCDEHDVVLILDEIYTGFGRTGAWFACEHEAVVPDIICLGTALSGGYPISAAVGRAKLIEKAWPASKGEARHTSTFLGNPVGCAMSLAQITEIHNRALPERSRELGFLLLDWLRQLQPPTGYAMKTRGIGLMAGIEINTLAGKPATNLVLGLVKSLLADGFLFLPEGEHSNVLAFTPPLTIHKGELVRAVVAVEHHLGKIVE